MNYSCQALLLVITKQEVLSISCTFSFPRIFLPVKWKSSAYYEKMLESINLMNSIQKSVRRVVCELFLLTQTTTHLCSMWAFFFSSFFLLSSAATIPFRHHFFFCIWNAVYLSWFAVFLSLAATQIITDGGGRVINVVQYNGYVFVR